MIVRFLRLFEEFRDLQEAAEANARGVEELQKQCEYLTREKLLLQDRLEQAMSETDRVWGIANEAIASERSSLRMQVNHAVQRASGGIPYPEEHSLPVESVRKLQAPGPIGRRSRITASEAIARSERKFIMEELIPALDPARAVAQ